MSCILNFGTTHLRVSSIPGRIFLLCCTQWLGCNHSPELPRISIGVSLWSAHSSGISCYGNLPTKLLSLSLPIFCKHSKTFLFECGFAFTAFMIMTMMKLFIIIAMILIIVSAMRSHENETWCSRHSHFASIIIFIVMTTIVMVMIFLIIIIIFIITIIIKSSSSSSSCDIDISLLNNGTHRNGGCFFYDLGEFFTSAIGPIYFITVSRG